MYLLPIFNISLTLSVVKGVRLYCTTLNIHDTKAGIEHTRLAYERYPSIEKFCADTGYRGIFVLDVDKILGLCVDISEKIKPHAWEKRPWRWVGERTFGWLNHFRCLSKDYEIATDSAEAVVKISHLAAIFEYIEIYFNRQRRTVGIPVAILLAAGGLARNLTIFIVFS